MVKRESEGFKWKHDVNAFSPQPTPRFFLGGGGKWSEASYSYQCKVSNFRIQISMNMIQVFETKSRR